MSRPMLVATLAALVLASHVRAQQADDLDGVLRGWDRASRDLKSLACGLEREVIDGTAKSRDAQQGFAMFLRAKGPDDLTRFRFELKSDTDPKVAQKFISAEFLYSYEPANKVVRVFDLAKFKSAVLERISLLSFIFEMDAELAKERYHLELAGADALCHYLRVRPKRERDRQDFSEARISLNRATGLPAQIWYRQPQGREITWNFVNVKINSDGIEPRHFNPEVPDGWRMERAKAAP